MAKYILEIEMRPQHFQDVAMWCMVQQMGEVPPMLHNFPDQFLSSVIRTKAIDSELFEELMDFVQELADKRFNNNLNPPNND